MPLLVKVLMALDLPALERPAKATSAPPSCGHSRIEGALVRNLAVWKLIWCINRTVAKDIEWLCHMVVVIMPANLKATPKTNTISAK